MVQHMLLVRAGSMDTASRGNYSRLCCSQLRLHIALALAILLLCPAERRSSPSELPERIEGLCTDPVSLTLLRNVNRVREAEGVEPLRCDETASRLATAVTVRQLGLTWLLPLLTRTNFGPLWHTLPADGRAVYLLGSQDLQGSGASDADAEQELLDAAAAMVSSGNASVRPLDA